MPRRQEGLGIHKFSKPGPRADGVSVSNACLFPTVCSSCAAADYSRRQAPAANCRNLWAGVKAQVTGEMRPTPKAPLPALQLHAMGRAVRQVFVCTQKLRSCMCFVDFARAFVCQRKSGRQCACSLAVRPVLACAVICQNIGIHSSPSHARKAAQPLSLQRRPAQAEVMQSATLTQPCRRQFFSNGHCDNTSSGAIHPGFWIWRADCQTSRLACCEDDEKSWNLVGDITVAITAGAVDLRRYYVDSQLSLDALGGAGVCNSSKSNDERRQRQKDA